MAAPTAFDRMLSPFADCTYAMFRIVTGALFTFHGVQKIFGVLSEHPAPEMFTQLWIGGLLELICGVAIALGWFTRPAAFIASGMMAVAYIQFHWKFQLDKNFFPAINHGELAVIYCFAFLHIACRGAGQWSVDRNRI